MHYMELIEAHKEYYKKEGRAFNYDEYMKCKDWKSWTNSVPICEAMKLFGFILGWEPKFEGDPWKFKEVYEKIYPTIKELEQRKIEDINLADEELKRKIQDVFDKVADCTRKGDRYESTAASKILHTILPNLFIMWDRKIREGTLGDEGRKKGRNYAYEFLPLVQTELKEAIKTYVTERNLNHIEAVRYISESCNGKTLTKLADEFNYMKYTMGWKASFEHKPIEVKKIDKEDFYREIFRRLFRYKLELQALYLKELAITSKDPKAIRLAETKEWNKLLDYLYEERYSELLSLYNEAQKRSSADPFGYWSLVDEENRGMFDDLPDGYGEFETPQDDQTIYDEDIYDEDT